MTRKLIAFASAAALIVGVGACKNTGSDTGKPASTSQSPGSTDSTSPQGRRGDTLPRARAADAGSDMSTGTPATPASPATNPSGSTGTSGSSGSTSGSSSGTDTKR